jgi:hypothetical protein
MVKNLENSLLEYFIKGLIRSEFYHRGNLNTQMYLAIFLIATSIAIGTTTSIATQASAEKPDKTGLDKADEKVHETPGGFAGKQDLKFHEGTCQGGHEVDIPEGCNNDLITDPGNSDDHRQDK